MKSPAEMCRHLHCRTYSVEPIEPNEPSPVPPTPDEAISARTGSAAGAVSARPDATRLTMILVGAAGILAGIAFVLAFSWLRGDAPVPDSSSGISSRRAGDEAGSPRRRRRVGSRAHVDRTAQSHLGERWIQDDRVRAAGNARCTGLDVPGPARARCPVPVPRDTDVRRPRLLGQLRGRRLPSDGSPAVGR